jgi:stearoyl-CoA desaturase (delta-9 desaturase)
VVDDLQLNGESRYVLLLTLSLCSLAGSILHWARDHRVHHKYAETDWDPHDATRGFFYAHVGWLMLKKSPKVIEAGKKLDFQDLHDDPVVMFQHKLDPWYALCLALPSSSGLTSRIEPFFCFVVPTLIGTHFCGQGAWESFLFLGVARYCFVLNSTWLVNSLAHWIGYKPYDKSINPTENSYVCFAFSFCASCFLCSVLLFVGLFRDFVLL